LQLNGLQPPSGKLLFKHGKIGLDICWAKKLSRKYKKNKKERLLVIIDALDIKAETTPLSLDERSDFKMANEKINKLRREEEMKWAQRAKVKYIHEGGIILNTSS
jgi:hypothetical protein